MLYPEEFAGGMGYRTETLSEEGNMKTGCIEISYDTVDLAGKTLNIDFLAEKRAGDPSTAVLNRHEDISATRTDNHKRSRFHQHILIL